MSDFWCIVQPCSTFLVYSAVQMCGMSLFCSALQIRWSFWWRSPGDLISTSEESDWCRHISMSVAAFSFIQPLHFTRLEWLLKAKRVEGDPEEQQPAIDLQELKQPVAQLEVKPRHGETCLETWSFSSRKWSYDYFLFFCINEIWKDTRHRTAVFRWDCISKYYFFRTCKREINILSLNLLPNFITFQNLLMQNNIIYLLL